MSYKSLLVRSVFGSSSGISARRRSCGSVAVISRCNSSRPRTCSARRGFQIFVPATTIPDQVRFLAVEIHAVGVLQDHDAGAQYALLGIRGSVPGIASPIPRQVVASSSRHRRHSGRAYPPRQAVRPPPDLLAFGSAIWSDPVFRLRDGAVRSGVLGGRMRFLRFHRVRSAAASRRLDWSQESADCADGNRIPQRA